MYHDPIPMRSATRNSFACSNSNFRVSKIECLDLPPFFPHLRSVQAFRPVSGTSAPVSARELLRSVREEVIKFAKLIRFQGRCSWIIGSDINPDSAKEGVALSSVRLSLSSYD